MVEPAPKPPSAESALETHPLQALTRFVRAVRYRKEVVLVALVVTAVLGGLYYGSVARIYQSKAELLIQKQADTSKEINIPGISRDAQDYMDTYRSVILSEAVLEPALNSLSPENRIDFQGVAAEKLVAKLQKNLQVTVVRKTSILQVSYSSHKPEAAAAVVDAVLTSFQKYIDTIVNHSAGEILVTLTKEKTSLEAQIHRTESDLIKLRSEIGTVYSGNTKDGASDLITQQAFTLQSLLKDRYDKRVQAQTLMESIQTAAQRGEDLRPFFMAVFSGPGKEGLLGNDAGPVQRQLTEDIAKLQSMQTVYGPNHKEIREIQRRIQQNEQLLRDRWQLAFGQAREGGMRPLATILLEASRQEYERALNAERLTKAGCDEALAKAIAMDRGITKMRALERELDRLNRSFEAVLENIKGINLQKENGTVLTSILARPEVLASPVWPTLSVVAGLTLLLGLGGGLAIVYVLDLLDDHFRSPEELQLHVGAPVLAMVRRMKTEAEHGIEAVFLHSNPGATEAESFRTLHTALALTEGGIRRLVLSSSEPGDGKTTVSSNLGMVFAQSGKRTLLIDADMRRPGLTSLLNLRGPRGLSSVLRDSASLDESLQANLHPAIVPNLDVLAAGSRPRNPAELLTSDRFSELISWAEEHYDQVLIDSPPALVADAAIIGRLTDGVLMVVRPEKNRRRTVLRAAEGFAALGHETAGDRHQSARRRTPRGIQRLRLRLWIRLWVSLCRRQPRRRGGLDANRARGRSHPRRADGACGRSGRRPQERPHSTTGCLKNVLARNAIWTGSTNGISPDYSSRVGQGRASLWWVFANRSSVAERCVTKLSVD